MLLVTIKETKGNGHGETKFFWTMKENVYICTIASGRKECRIVGENPIDTLENAFSTYSASILSQQPYDVSINFSRIKTLAFFHNPIRKRREKSLIVELLPKKVSMDKMYFFHVKLSGIREGEFVISDGSFLPAFEIALHFTSKLLSAIEIKNKQTFSRFDINFIKDLST